MANVRVGYDFGVNEIPTKANFEQQAQISLTGLAFGDINFQTNAGVVPSSASDVSYPAENWLRFDIDSTLWVNFTRGEARAYMGRRWGMETMRWPYADGPPRDRRLPMTFDFVDGNDTGPSNIKLGRGTFSEDPIVDQADTAASNATVSGATPHRATIMGFNWFYVGGAASRPFSVGRRDNASTKHISDFDPLGSQSGSQHTRQTLGAVTHDEAGLRQAWTYFAGAQFFRAE